MTMVSATPVEKAPVPNRADHDKRQLSGLTGILKGIMDSSSGAGSSAPHAGNTATASTTSADTTAFQQCSDAISKIEASLSISAKYMKAAGGSPTPQEIQAVLTILEQSLGADCGDGLARRDTFEDISERSEGPLAGVLGDGNGNGNPLGIGILRGGGDNEDKECEDDETCEISHNGRTAKRALSITSRCSDCEPQLYNIVKELQVIFDLGLQSTSTLSSMSSPITTVSTASLIALMTPLTNSTFSRAAKL